MILTRPEGAVGVGMRRGEGGFCLALVVVIIANNGRFYSIVMNDFIVAEAKPEVTDTARKAAAKKEVDIFAENDDMFSEHYSHVSCEHFFTA